MDKEKISAAPVDEGQVPDIEKKEMNYAAKVLIVEELKQLLEKAEDVSGTFQAFRELQGRWKSIGVVPQAKVKDLLESYQYYVEKLYDYIKINKEFRDMDFRKNMEAKEALCIKAEELAQQENAVDAFKELQKLHEQWKETGPVAKEYREQMWERFKAATSAINKRHQQYYEQLKETQKRNLEAKTALCERAEEIADTVPDSSNEWNDLSKKMDQLQAEWKNLGFASKKDNQKIYDRFRAACDRFFENKARALDEEDQKYEENLQQKLQIIAQIKEYRMKNVREEDIRAMRDFQNRWNEIGFVPFKEKERIQKEYNEVMDARFADIRSVESEKQLKKFRRMVTEVKKTGKGARGLKFEREKLVLRYRKIEQDIATLENNMGFFAKSKNADSMMTDVARKIVAAKDELLKIEEKIKIIDTYFE